MVEPVVEGLAGHRDGEVAHGGEVRQAEPSGLVHLAEDDFPLGAVQRPPGADPPLQGAAHAATELGMAPQHLLEDGDRPQARTGPQQGNGLALPDTGQRVRPAAASRGRLLRWRTGVLLDPVGGRGAEPGLGGGDRHRLCAAELHVQPHLAVGDMAAGQQRGPFVRKEPIPLPNHRDRQTARPLRDHAPAAVVPSVGPRPPCGTTAAILILIAAQFSS